MTELVWTKKGSDYILHVKDGYKFVKGWRKRRMPEMEPCLRCGSIARGWDGLGVPIRWVCGRCRCPLRSSR
jgi:ribosomal protein S27AE